MAGVPAPLTKLNQAGQDALKQNLQGVSFSNSVPAPQDPAAQYKAAANAYTASHWYNGGTTATPSTQAQNLAAVVNQPGNTAAQNPTPFIQGVLGQAAKDTAAQQVPKPNSGVAATNGAVPNVAGPSVPAFDAKGEAASRVAARRAALAASVNAYDTSRKQGFDYTTKNTQDQRVLDAAMFHEQNNPFSGKYQYDKTNILRNNDIQDTQNQMQYNNDIAAQNQKLADFDAGAPGMQQDIENQLNQQSFTNTLAQNQDNRAQQTLDYNQSPTNPSNAGQLLNNQLTQLKLSDYPAQSQAAAQQTQQQLQAGQISNETAQFKLEQLKDPNSPTNQAAAIDLQLKQIDLANAPQEARLKIQQLQKQIAQIGAAPYKSDTERQIEEQNLLKIKAEVANLNNKPAPGNFNLDDYKGHINNVFYSNVPSDPTDPLSPKTKVFDKAAAQKYVDSLSLPTDQKNQLYQIYGLQAVSDSAISQYLK